MDATASDAVFRFDRFALYPNRGLLLTTEGQEITLRPKAFAVLRLLVENAGRLLDRDAIMRAVWSDVIIADDGITQCIRDIRRALADDAQRIVRTVRQRGYILALEVTVTRERSSVRTQTQLVADKPSIAVLPFRNLSADLEQEFFSDGIADDIITELSRSRSLLVTARNSSFAYRGQPANVKRVARELGVRYVVEGSVRRDAGRVRINAQLLEAETGNHIWAERYDREIEQMFATQGRDYARSHLGDPACCRQRRVPALPAQAARKPWRMGGISAWSLAYEKGKSGRKRPGKGILPTSPDARRDVRPCVRSHGND
jgi:TolB-like protein